MRNTVRIILPALVVAAVAASGAVALRSDNSPPAQAQAADTDAVRLRYALTSANASVAIAADRAAALEREVALLDVTVGNLTDKLEGATGAAVSIDASGSITLLYPPKPEPAPRTSAKTGGGWKTATASWYGPGLYGNTTADGTLFTADTWCVAHKTLPFGTIVQITYGGRIVDVPVRDRGPFVPGREFDLSAAVARSLGFSGVHPIEWRVKP